MSPRPYRLGKRQIANEETRGRIVAAARTLLADPSGPAFTIDAVAERADVARMTVYYQFKSKAGLLEALFDDIGARTDMKRLRTAFGDSDAERGLAAVVDIFCQAWHAERGLVRRLNALAALDPEVDQALTERGGWRRGGLAELVRRLQIDRRPGELIDLLHMLTSFETYDKLAAPGRTPADVASMLQRTVRSLLATERA